MFDKIANVTLSPITFWKNQRKYTHQRDNCRCCSCGFCCCCCCCCCSCCCCCRCCGSCSSPINFKGRNNKIWTNDFCLLTIGKSVLWLTREAHDSFTKFWVWNITHQKSTREATGEVTNVLCLLQFWDQISHASSLRVKPEATPTANWLSSLMLQTTTNAPAV